MFYRTFRTEFNKLTELSVMFGTIAHGILDFVSLVGLVAVVYLQNWVSCHTPLVKWYEGLFGWSWKGVTYDDFDFICDVQDALDNGVRSPKPCNFNTLKF